MDLRQVISNILTSTYSFTWTEFLTECATLAINFEFVGLLGLLENLFLLLHVSHAIWIDFLMACSTHCGVVEYFLAIVG